jgi:hypothetical protein
MVMVVSTMVPATALAAGVPRSLTCSSLGWMGGNPKSLQIANRDGGALVVRAGTTFKWTMSPSGQSGVITLDADLKSGATRVYDGVLKGALEQNVDCKIGAA